LLGCPSAACVVRLLVGVCPALLLQSHRFWRLDITSHLPLSRRQSGRRTDGRDGGPLARARSASARCRPPSGCHCSWEGLLDLCSSRPRGSPPPSSIMMLLDQAGYLAPHSHRHSHLGWPVPWRAQHPPSGRGGRDVRGGLRHLRTLPLDICLGGTGDPPRPLRRVERQVSCPLWC